MSAITKFSLTLYGQRVAGISVPAGSTVEWDLAIQDPVARAAFDLTGANVVLALSRVDAAGRSSGAPLVARQATISSPASAGNCVVLWNAADTAAFLPGIYGLEVWLTDAAGNRLQALAFVEVLLTAAAYPPNGVITALPSQAPLALGPQGVQGIPSPTYDAIGTISAPLTLRGVSGSSSVKTVITSGFYAPNDGGGGLFVWDGTSVLADDGGTIIAPTGVGTGRWIRQHEGVFNPKWFGAKGDDINDDQPAFQAMINAIPVGGGKVHIPRGNYKFVATAALATHVIIDRPLVFAGSGIQGTRFFPKTGCCCFHVESQFVDGGGKDAYYSHFRDFGILYNGYAPTWQPNHTYNVGDIVVNQLWYGNFTYLVNVCTVAGMSSGTEPNWFRRVSQNQINYPGHPLSDGGVTWTAVYGAGIYVQGSVFYVDRVTVQGASGDGIFVQGQGGGIGVVDDFEVSNALLAGNMGWGFAVEGSDAQVGRVKVQAIGNYSGGIDDQCLNGNLYTSCDSETNGIQRWGPLAFSQFGQGISAVYGLGFTTQSWGWLASHPKAQGRLFQMTAGFVGGQSAATEPSWDLTVGNSTTDGTITWKCVATYDRGFPYNVLDWTAINNAQFIQCYEEPDQRASHIPYPAMVMSAIGMSFDSESNAIILGNEGLVSRGLAWTNVIPNAGVNPLFAALGADDGGQWTLILAGKGTNSGQATDVLRLLPDAAAKYWVLQQASKTVFEVAITGAPDPYGALIHPDRVIVRPVADAGTNPASRVWWGSTSGGSDPAAISALEPNHRVGDIIVNVDAVSTPGVIGALPSGWINVGSGGSPIWKEFRFDFQRPIVTGTGGTIGSPTLIGLPPGSTASLRGNVYTDDNGISSEVGYTLPVVGGRADLKYHFAVRLGKGIKVFAQSGDKIGIGNVLSSAGGALECVDRTGFLTLESIGDSGTGPIWIATSVVGTWAVS